MAYSNKSNFNSSAPPMRQSYNKPRYYKGESDRDSYYERYGPSDRDQQDGVFVTFKQKSFFQHAVKEVDDLKAENEKLKKELKVFTDLAEAKAMEKIKKEKKAEKERIRKQENKEFINGIAEAFFMRTNALNPATALTNQKVEKKQNKKKKRKPSKQTPTSTPELSPCKSVDSETRSPAETSPDSQETSPDSSPTATPSKSVISKTDSGAIGLEEKIETLMKEYGGKNGHQKLASAMKKSGLDYIKGGIKPNIKRFAKHLLD